MYKLVVLGPKSKEDILLVVQGKKKVFDLAKKSVEALTMGKVVTSNHGKTNFWGTEKYWELQIQNISAAEKVNAVVGLFKNPASPACLLEYVSSFGIPVSRQDAILEAANFLYNSRATQA